MPHSKILFEDLNQTVRHPMDGIWRSIVKSFRWRDRASFCCNLFGQLPLLYLNHRVFKILDASKRQFRDVSMTLKN